MSSANTVKFTSDKDTSGTTSRASTATTVLNQWQHVVATWNGQAGGTNVHLFINGVKAEASSKS